MKTGKTLTELAAELDRQRTEMRDFIAPISQTTMQLRDDNNPVLKLSDIGEFGITEIAHEQLAGHTNIPTKYYNRMLVDSPELLQHNVNHWLTKFPTEQRLVRTLDGNVRAFLSNRYRPLDNYDLAQVALPALMESGCKIESCEITDTKMYLKAVTPKLSYEIKKGDVVQAGIVISNSWVWSFLRKYIFYSIFCI